MNRCSENSPAFQRWVSIKRIPEVPSGTAERWKLLALLSSLKGLRYFCAMILPALKRWAIFGSTDGRQRDTLRLAS
jgi:hypothetical protein